jgi:hypothetical protein
MARCQCQVMLATALPTHAGDGVTKVTWPRRDVDVDSCWRRHCQVMLAMTLQLKVVLAMVRLHSPRAQSMEVLS